MFAYRGYKQCQDQRAALELCRATPYGKHVSPEHCEKEAANMLECYHQRYMRLHSFSIASVLHARKNCGEAYKQTFDCLKKGSTSKWQQGAHGVCSKLLDEFAKC